MNRKKSIFIFVIFVFLTAGNAFSSGTVEDFDTPVTVTLRNQSSQSLQVITRECLQKDQDRKTVLYKLQPGGSVTLKTVTPDFIFAATDYYYNYIWADSPESTIDIEGNNVKVYTPSGATVTDVNKNQDHIKKLPVSILELYKFTDENHENYTILPEQQRVYTFTDANLYLSGKEARDFLVELNHIRYYHPIAAENLPWYVSKEDVKVLMEKYGPYSYTLYEEGDLYLAYSSDITQYSSDNQGNYSTDVVGIINVFFFFYEDECVYYQMMGGSPIFSEIESLFNTSVNMYEPLKENKQGDYFYTSYDESYVCELYQDEQFNYVYYVATMAPGFDVAKLQALFQ
ncbi:MAG: hypothetical protein JW760_05725 [Spirochaetales bacterium]|nr:hypothetical protein [Spirochaetales bacterium]